MIAVSVPTDSMPPDLPAPATPRLRGLRVVLIIAALLETFLALPKIFILFDDMSDMPTGLGGFLFKANIVTHLPLALAVLALAIKGRLRHAIIALAAIVLMTWLNFMPSVILRGLEFGDAHVAEWTTRQIIVFPLMAACAIALAARDQRLGIATALASIPTFWNVLGVAVFTISVIINGF